MNKFSKLAAAAALAVAGVGAQAAFVIDDFSTSQALIRDTTTDGNAVWATQSCGAGIIGGCRDLYVTKTGNSLDDAIGLGVSAFVSGGRLGYSQDTGQAGIGVVRWDGANAAPAIDTAGLGGLDLTAGMVVGIRVEVLSADLGFPMTFQAWLDGNNDNVFSMFTSTATASSGPGIYDFLFTGFTGGPVADLDFSRVGAIQLVLNNGSINDIDIQIDIIQSIPEPGTLALVGATLLGLGAARRRANKA
jgi:hypothetical protein